MARSRRLLARRRPMSTVPMPSVTLGLVLLGLVVVGPAMAEPRPADLAGARTDALGGLIFADGFESGDTSRWSNAVGLITPPTAFRMTDLDLRDPHVFVDLSPLCLDFTDTPIPLTDISFNGNLETLLTTDGDMDGFLDLSPLLLFRPFDPLAVAERVDFLGGACVLPPESTSCVPAATAVPAILSYDGSAAATCLDALAGTTSGYSPAVTGAAAPCFVTVAETLDVDLLGVTVSLQQAQIGATFFDDPVTTLDPGLLRGFLSESDADEILLPPDLPVIGGQPLSVLLPGGTGNCAAGDDRDMLDGQSGWWFYFQMVADEVPFTDS